MVKRDKIEKAHPFDDRFLNYVRACRSTRFGGKTSASATGVGSCGDKLHVELYVENHVIQQVRCHPEGCAYTAACGGAVAELARGHTLGEALQIQPENVVCALGGLPEDHVHCARLAVNTLGEAIAEYYRRQMTAGKAGWDRF